MSATKTGGKKLAAKLLARDPDHYRKMGAIGGKNGHTGGFTDRDLARRAGAIGGRISRRPKATQNS